MNRIDLIPSGFPVATQGILAALPKEEAPAQLLLVDDEPRMLSSLCELLKNRGFDISTADNGTQAIRQLSEKTFDLVILDLRLPDISGHDVMDFMISRQINSHVIVTSGENGIDAAIGALKRGAFGYLRKPYPREELIKTLLNALEQRRLNTENKRITKQLENSERIYRHLVDSSPDIIFTLDQDRRFTFLNHRVEQLLGFSSEELMGKHYSVVVNQQDLERAHFAFNGGRSDVRWSHHVELRLKTRQSSDVERTFSIELLTTSLNPLPGQSQDSDTMTPRNMRGIYGVARDITDRKRADELIAYQAYHDILTNLPNRILFKDRLGLAIMQSKRRGASLAVMFVDLDRFKVVNDSLGHPMGDELLKQTAVRLKDCLRRCDTLSRFGGDEFTAVLPELSGLEDAVTIAEKFLESLRLPFLLAGQPIHISTSIGIAVYPNDGETVDELIRNADLAMYQMKAKGRNGYALFHRSMLDISSKKIALEHGLHVALSMGELEMYYQPQVDIRTGKITGAEALMRWNHPERGFLGAAEFLPFAEESGLIIPISDWMLEAVSRDLLKWNAVSNERLRLSINLSPHCLERGDFFEKLRSTLFMHQIDPSQIEVEVTENICIRNPLTAIEQLNKLCLLGVSVAIDDFGTGYSSLSYLHRFPVHTLKIDRSFVIPIENELSLCPVVLAIISIAKGLNLNVVAEGVETLAQANYLENSGCNTMQGYFYHHPLSQNKLLELIAQTHNPINIAAVEPMSLQ